MIAVRVASVAMLASCLGGCLTPTEVANPDAITLRTAVNQVVDTLHEAHDRYKKRSQAWPLSLRSHGNFQYLVTIDGNEWLAGWSDSTSNNKPHSHHRERFGSNRWCWSQRQSNRNHLQECHWTCPSQKQRPGKINQINQINLAKDSQSMSGPILNLPLLLSAPSTGRNVLGRSLIQIIAMVSWRYSRRRI